MTDRELMQQALDALEWCYDVTEWPANGKSAQDKAIEALRTRLTQPEPEELGEVIPADEEQLKRIAKLIEPEPVAWMVITMGEVTSMQPHMIAAEMLDGTHQLYTAPPQREWQGLTEYEVGFLTVFDGLHDVEVPLLANFIRHIEAKLKAKNV